MRLALDYHAASGADCGGGLCCAVSFDLNGDEDNTLDEMDEIDSTVDMTND